MTVALITLTTDFGADSSYVAAMKGAIWSVAPDARVADFCHSIPAQDVPAAALFLRDVVPFYPPNTVHVIVVDPGVGTDRAALLIQWNQQILLAPDNGCWTSILDGQPAMVRRLTQSQYWRLPVSATFHGRDIFAPVAGHLWRGVKPDELGEPIHNWKVLKLAKSKTCDGRIVGEIVAVDHFGNLISNISSESLAAIGPGPYDAILGAVRIGPLRRTYGDQTPHTLVALISSNGYVELAEVNGSAANRLGIGVGEELEIASALVSPGRDGTTT